MNQKIISTEDEVKAFLKELKELLTDAAFDLSRDLDILPKKRDESPIDPYTTANTFATAILCICKINTKQRCIY